MSEFDNLLDTIKCTDSIHEIVLKSWNYRQSEIDSLNKQLSEIKDKYILRGQEIDLLNRKIYDKDQIIDAFLSLDDEEKQND